MYIDTQKYVIVAHFVWFYLSESFSVNLFVTFCKSSRIQLNKC